MGETPMGIYMLLGGCGYSRCETLGPFWDGKLDRQPIYFEQNCGPSVADTVGVPQFLSSCSNDFRQEA